MDSIDKIASLITEDPDIINEAWGKPKTAAEALALVWGDDNKMLRLIEIAKTINPTQAAKNTPVRRRGKPFKGLPLTLNHWLQIGRLGEIKSIANSDIEQKGTTPYVGSTIKRILQKFSQEGI